MDEKTEVFLWDTKYPRECKKLPYEYLEADEQTLVDKCVNKEELTDEEKKQILSLLKDYRGLFKEYDVERIEENLETSEKIVKTQSELLRLIHDKDRYRIDMNYWINGEKYLLQMRIKPYTDKQYLEAQENQFGIFDDLNIEERKIVSKSQNKQPLSPEEQKMHKHIIDKINEKVEDNDFLIKMVNEFLADRIEFIGDEKTSFEDNILFWKEVDLGTRISLFHEVRERLRLGETFREDLFPAVR